MTLNAIYKLEKQNKIFELLEENPEETLDKISEEMKNSQFSISIYEKMFILKAQLAYVDLLMKNYELKIPKDPKNKDKLEKYIQIKERMLRSLEEYKEQFSFLFKKPINHYYY